MNVNDFEEYWKYPDRYVINRYFIDGSETFLISEKRSSFVLVIEDEGTLDFVVRKMISAGVQVVDR